MNVNASTLHGNLPGAGTGGNRNDDSFVSVLTGTNTVPTDRTSASGPRGHMDRGSFGSRAASFAPVSSVGDTETVAWGVLRSSYP